MLPPLVGRLSTETVRLSAAWRQNRPPVHSAVPRGSVFGQKGYFRYRVATESASSAFCGSTRQRFRAKVPFPLPRYDKIGHRCDLGIHAATTIPGSVPWQRSLAASPGSVPGSVPRQRPPAAFPAASPGSVPWQRFPAASPGSVSRQRPPQHPAA